MEIEKEIDTLEVIVGDLCLIGLQNLHDITDFSFVTLRYVEENDEKERIATLTIELNGDYGSIPLKFTCDLPCYSPDHDIFRLPELYRHFAEVVKDYNKFWDVCDSIDERCWVIEPSVPKMVDTERRIVVNPTTTIKISVAPKDPLIFPDLQIFGPDEFKAKLLENIDSRIDLWDESDDFVSNLERVLNLKLPSKEENTQTSTTEPSCGICLTSELEGSYPEVNCSSDVCGQIFHTKCFIEYVETQPNALRTRFVVKGDCPYCSSGISCSR